MVPHRARPRYECALRAVLLASLLTSSCTVHVHRVGGGPTGVGEESARQFYAFFGLMRLNEVDAQRVAGDLVGYEIRTEYSFVDLLLFPLLLPLTATSRTVTVSW